MRTNFTKCAIEYSATTTEGDALRAQYGWHGPIRGLARNDLTLISLEGCLHLCGNGIDYYPWIDASSTITTWVLPVIGTLLQAPFESNAFKRTIWAITRWVGSPIASLSYVLWNIKVSAKAALMVDMAVPYDEMPDRKSDYRNMRDSMYLLLAMNQYKMNSMAVRTGKEAEGLLRIVLFSRDLKLTDTDKTLRQMRRILARELREIRRRGVVPVFVSTLWFLFAFALSIQAAFGDVGENRTAHDLALGCLLAWFPILILASIVDRNPIAAEPIRKKLNSLIDHVRNSLRDSDNRQDFLDSFKDQLPQEYETLKNYVTSIDQKAEFMGDFFVDFAGQGRIRWHYGAAHPILSDIENCYIAAKGRNWLADEGKARMSLVLGPSNDEGLVWFDIREFWQVASAIIIVGASCGGAFILSYFTPTVGLGCRSGGYTIFFSVSLGLMIFEMIIWLILSPYEMDDSWLRTRLQRSTTFQRVDEVAHGTWARLKRRTSTLLNTSGLWLTQNAVRVTLWFPWKNKDEMGARVEAACDRLMTRLQEMIPARKWEVFFFRPVETFNTIWLLYIVTAQTLGWYKTCRCVTSTWAGAGGYLDFSQQDTTNNKWVEYYWITGTLVTSVMMGLSMFYITVEWTQQSFLSTEDYDDSLRGLRMTRTYRNRTLPFRWISRKLMGITLDPLEKLAIAAGIIKKPQSTLLWTKKHTHNPDVPRERATSATMYTRHQYQRPSFELTDYSGAAALEHDDSRTQQDTPAMPYSLFPPAISRRRPRNSSDDSPILPSFHGRNADRSVSGPSSLRYSEESLATPLMSIRRPSETHQYRERLGSADSDNNQQGDDYRPDSEDFGSAALSPPLQQSVLSPLLGRDTTLHIRQGYVRANSDPGSPPASGGLGIDFDRRDVEAGSRE